MPEIQATNIRFYARQSVGCRNHKKDIMLSVLSSSEDGQSTVMTDVFLTDDQMAGLMESARYTMDINTKLPPHDPVQA